MKELEYPSYPSIIGGRMSWSAVFAGTVMALAVMSCLSMLGIGIGFMTAPAADSGRNLAVAAGIGGTAWLLVAGLISFYIGGWVASRMSSTGRAGDGVIHGLVSWGTATLVAVFMVTSAIGGLFGTVAGAAGSAAQGAAQVGAEQSRGAAGGGDIVDRMKNLGEQARRAGDELRQESRQAQARSDVTRQDVQEKAQTASRAAGGFGLFGFLSMALQALAAALGGRSGARLIRPVPASEYGIHRERPVVATR